MALLGEISEAPMPSSPGLSFAKLIIFASLLSANSRISFSPVMVGDGASEPPRLIPDGSWRLPDLVIRDTMLRRLMFARPRRMDSGILSISKSLRP